MKTRLSEADLAAAVFLALNARDRGLAKRFAEELLGRLDETGDALDEPRSMPSTDGRTDAPPSSTPAPPNEEPHDLAAIEPEPASSVHVRPSSSSPISISSQEKKTDGRVTVYEDDARPEWAKGIHAQILALRPGLPPLDEVVWPNFVAVMRERGKSYASLDGLKKRFRDFCRWERVDGPKQESLTFTAPPKSPPSRPEHRTIVSAKLRDPLAIPLAQASGFGAALLAAAIEPRTTGPPVSAPDGA